MPVALEVNHVWKKFFQGEINDSLRDAIPALCKSLIGLGPKREDLQKGDFWALKDLNFQVQEGETVAFIGHNGAGKSTLLKILSKILKPNRGSIKVNGKLRSLIEIGSGFHGDLTGRENIFLNGSILGMSHKEIASKLDSIIDFSGIEEFLDMPVKRYSSGMYARLGFAVAAHLEPDILIVDEVLSVGDTAFQKKCLGKMNEVANEGRTVLFVSHNMAAVRNLCQRSILLQKGEMIDDGPTEKVIHTYLDKYETNVNKRLAERTDHIGNGNIRFEDIEIFCNGSPILSNAIPIGCQLKIRLKYSCLQRVDNPVFYIAFYDQNDTSLLSIDTDITERKLIKIDSSGILEFNIDSLPLLPKHYYVNLSIHAEGKQEDRLSHVWDFDVLPGTYHHAINLQKQATGIFMTDYSWNLQ